MTNEEAQNLISEIIHTLQDDYGYLKPQPKSTAGNIQGDGVYNWEAHNVLEDLFQKKFNIPQGKKLGENLKLIEDFWINNNFKISEEQIEKIIKN